MNKPIVLILCGGKSLRLWPLSEYKSKNFLDIFGFLPLDITVKRFLEITPVENIFLVTNKKEKDTFEKLKIIKRENIFFEPESKNTAAAILFSIFHLKKILKKDNILIISPVDHIIKEETKFYSAINKAIDIAKKSYISTLGITPQKAVIDFGYIEAKKEIENNVFSIKTFIEKPSRIKAQEFIKKGNSFYNSGIFISLISTLEKEYKKYYKNYNDFLKVFKNKINDELISSLYKKLPDIPFDLAIMEKTKRGALIKGEFFWRDFGNWQAIYDILDKDKDKNVKKAIGYLYGSENNFIYVDNPNKKILALGIKDIFFIDTENYTLLANRAYLENLKIAIKDFKEKI